MPEWSDPIVKVYEDCTDAILVNIARHFPIDEEVSDMFIWVFNNLFSTASGGPGRDVTDVHAYLIKFISSRMKTCYGPDPLESWGIGSA